MTEKIPILKLTRIIAVLIKLKSWCSKTPPSLLHNQFNFLSLVVCHLSLSSVWSLWAGLFTCSVQSPAHSPALLLFLLLPSTSLQAIWAAVSRWIGVVVQYIQVLYAAHKVEVYVTTNKCIVCFCFVFSRWVSGHCYFQSMFYSKNVEHWLFYSKKKAQHDCEFVMWITYSF